MRKKSFVLISAVFLFLFAILAVRLFYLCVIQGNSLREQAVSQRVRSFDYYQYARGDIVDRYGRAMVNVPESCLLVIPAMIPSFDAAAEALAKVLEQDKTEILLRMQQGEQRNVAPYILKTGLSTQQVAGVQRLGIPGLLCVELAARYDAQHTAIHTIGYVQPLGEDGAYVGVSGLEQQYDAVLSDRVDKRVVAVVDGLGALSAEDLLLEEAEHKQTSCLKLSLDRDYQQIAEQAFASLGYEGACVIMDPQNGDIQALVSAPAFDPYGWSSADGDVYLNKALSLYHPASTFKIVLALAALSEGISLPAVDTSQIAEASAEEEEIVFICTGSYTMAGGHTVTCSHEGGHGALTLSRALAVSCNCCFVALGEQIGSAEITRWADKLGLRELQVLGYQTPSYEAADFLSFSVDSEGDLANVCLGEKGVQLSVVQVATLLSVCANGGYLVTPRLLYEIDYADGSVEEIDSATPVRVVDADVAEQLKQMLSETVRTGTATAANGQYLSVAGKTGSSESGSVWFSGFAPVEDAQLVIAVCVRQGVAGGIEAAAVFKYIVDAIALLEGWA